MDLKLAVLGAGKMGRAIACDFCRQKDVKQVTLLEENPRVLKEAAGFVQNPKLKAVRADLSSPSQIARLTEGHTAVASALPYFLNLGATRAAIQNCAHFVDLGGNDAVVAAQRKLDRAAKKSRVAVVPEVGLAPGLASILAYGGMALFDSVDEIHMRVGGLPLHPKPPLKYQGVFSLDGLINEYVEPAKVLKEEKLALVESMDGLESIDFPEPFGRMEAFYTSGGAAALPELLKGKVKNLDYKTIRYPGHAEKIRTCIELGLASQKKIVIGKTKVTPRAVWIKLLSELLPKTGPDVILLRVWLDGFKAGRKMRLAYEMMEKADSKFTAMMKATALPASIIALFLARGEISRTGVLRQEKAVPLKKFIAELEARGLRVDSKLEEIQ
ncbi:MAG: saccharopine dehydrogenase NADP-binding domain-containing protein [candidate division Zixibacteria bacterium]|nr:saccharopine dehydrogenase NADP-binding domain-containing protein [candidate division Zixibacteria bacterium]MCI0595855.1 saccharopine dehydrogenase NADP-binding domain-containing protein [candidate division Zixibacteria bacterium]